MSTPFARQLSIITLVFVALTTALPAQIFDGGVELSVNGASGEVVVFGGSNLSIQAGSGVAEQTKIFLVASIATAEGGLSPESLVLLAEQSVPAFGRLNLEFTVPDEVAAVRVAIQAFALTENGQILASPVQLVKFTSL